MKIKINDEIFNKKYIPYFHNQKRFLVLYGSAASGKSYFAGQKLLIRTMTEPNHRFAIIRKQATNIRKSQFKQLKDLINAWGIKKYFNIKELEMIMTFEPNGSEIMALGVDDPEKVKSVAGITGGWMEEPTELDQEEFEQMDLRLRGETEFYKQWIMSFNPVNKKNWIYSYFFGNPSPDIIPDMELVHTTFADNRFLDAQYLRTLKRMEHTNPEYYKIYALGEWGDTGKLVFKPLVSLPKENYPTEFNEVFYGMDFGFNHPTALLKIGNKDGIYYISEMIYQTELTKSQLVNRMKELNISPYDPIYCDSAEPDTIDEIRMAGFYAIPSKKYNGSTKDHIDLIKSLHYRLRTCPENINLNREIGGFTYKKDIYGKYSDEPVNIGDDAIAALRYALFTHIKNEKDIKMFFMN